MYETHVACTLNQRDLRYKPQLDGDLIPMEQFNSLPMGDVWEDADLVGPLMFAYLYVH